MLTMQMRENVMNKGNKDFTGKSIPKLDPVRLIQAEEEERS